MKDSIWPTVLMILIILVATAYIANGFGRQFQARTENMLAEDTPTLSPVDEANSEAPAQECPEVLIVNRMPQIGNGGGESSYYILDGKSYQPNQLDLDWIARNCQVPTEEVY